ncbi:MAG: T9SS type A sorting domain-containing protein [Bacteroidetes bacterium]|nr:T9SS type A sorting domain-containing protein [Bacteroidota bacterium]
MKKIYIASFTLLSSIGLNAQVNVTTAVTKRVPVLEEYTGNYCTYCPDGHKIANQIEASTDGLTLKIQTGGFSGTDPVFGGTLQTTTGNAIAGPFSSASYPNGTINRGATTKGIGRGSWTSAANAIKAQDSPVNLHIASTIDIATRQMTVTVEYYYTASEANATNYLNIGYYQDNIPAYQVDPLSLYPNQFYMFNEKIYDFDHAFRDMLTGTWGEIVNTTTATSTGIITKTISLPAAFSTFAVEPGAIKVFAFMTKAAQGEIITAAKATPVYSNFPGANEIGAYYITPNNLADCIGKQGTFAPKAIVANYGSDDVTGFNSEFSINNGTAAVKAWTGTMKHNEKTVVTLDPMSFVFQASNTAKFEVKSPNGAADPVATNDVKSSTFSGGAIATASKIRIDAKVDQYGAAESTWELYNDAGAMIANSGTLTNSATTYRYVALPAGVECYKMVLKDSYGDSWGSGSSLKIYNFSTNTQGALIANIDATKFTNILNNGAEFTSNGAALGIEELNSQDFSVYPNPASTVLNVSFEANKGDYTIALVDLQGRVVYTNEYNNLDGVQSIAIPVSDFNSGSYMVKITNGLNTVTKNIAIQ